jgi:hypothetical protein
MKRLLALLHRVLAYLAIRSTERRLHDALGQYRHHACPVASLAHDIEVERLSEELARRRAAYIAATRKPGERLTFELA